MRRFVLIALLSLAAAAGAEVTTPVGRWKTIDDNTGLPKGLVELYQQGDELQGRIVGSFPRPGETPETLCSKCPGERKDQPKIGMVFLWGLTRDGEVWRGGEILDPDNGNIYDAKLKLTDGGEKLEVRGFLGLSLLGRTQTWLREP